MVRDLNFIRKNYNNFILIIYVSFLLILLFGFSLLVFIPKVKNFRLLEVQLEKNKSKIISSQTTLSQTSELKEDIKKIESDIEGYRNRLGKDIEFSVMLKELTAFALDLEIEFLSIKPLPTVDLKLGEGEDVFSIYETPISMKVKGGYNELLRFIGRIEKANNFIRVDDIKITDDPKEIWRHNAEITVSSFVLKTN